MSAEPATGEAVLRVRLLDGVSSVALPDVRSLVAQDASGQFGLMPGHAAFLTVLEPGLFRYRSGPDAPWRFGACAGGLLRCERVGGQTEVRIVSRRFLLGEAPEALQTQLDALLAAEQAMRVSTRDNMEQLDLALMRRMQELAQSAT